jgi:hypothetical protein
MFSGASLLRIAFTSILSSVAFNIGWYGIGSAWVLVGGIGSLALAVAIGWHAINRWQTTGYKRISEKVKLPATVGTRSDGTPVRTVARPASGAAPVRPASSAPPKSKAS